MKPSTLALAAVAACTTCACTFAAHAQTTCAELDLVPDGTISIADFAQGINPCIAGGGADCDFDGDGDSDGADLAFFLANFNGCRSASLSTPTAFGLPVADPMNRLLAADISDSADIDAGYREFEVRFRLPGPDAELISVTGASLGCGAPPCFTDPGNALSTVLSAAQIAAFGATGDSYITIGDRSGEPAPAAVFGFIESAPFAAGQSFEAGPLGWFLSPIDAIGFPGSPGLGSADGNTDNTVTLIGVAQTAPTLSGTIAVAYTHGGQLFISAGDISTTAEPCPADANGNGQLTPGDFNAWVLAFNSQAPACDQNGDGLCTPADFNAWVLNFNAGC
ncbi:MAG: GC-type dockerin domain-anchored protein [Planctomycetota bacterium]